MLSHAAIAEPRRTEYRANDKSVTFSVRTDVIGLWGSDKHMINLTYSEDLQEIYFMSWFAQDTDILTLPPWIHSDTTSLIESLVFPVQSKFDFASMLPVGQPFRYNVVVTESMHSRVVANWATQSTKEILSGANIRGCGQYIQRYIAANGYDQQFKFCYSACILSMGKTWSGGIKFEVQNHSHDV